MANAPPAGPRLLFVIDNDYGGLGLVMYFLHRQPFAARATLLLPARAQELHEGRLPVASRAYRSLRDILDAVEAESPDAVFLVSGYLFHAQGVLRIAETRELVRALRERGCMVATTDPYLGAFRRIAEADLGGWLSRLRLALHVRRAAAVLEGLPQIYPSPMDPGPGRFSFFNPSCIRAPGELDRREATARPGWLFVLAQFDLELQERLHGRQGFADRVTEKIRETLANGRDATFIGPAPIVEELARRLAVAQRFGSSGVAFESRGGEGLTLITRCPYDEFERRLLEAEIAFYWQIFPTSAFMRLWNGLPAFFFDRGHNARLLQPMHEAGLKHYYVGGAPTYLDISRPLDACALLACRPEFDRFAAEAREHLSLLPTPQAMLEAISAASGSGLPTARGPGRG